MGVRLPRNTAVQDAQPTFPVDPATGLPADAGGAPGTSNTTEETQLGVLAAVEDMLAAVEGASTPYFHGDVGAAKYLVGAAGARVLTDYFVENPHASAKAFLQIFDAAAPTDVTLGTTVPKWSIPLAAGKAANLANLAIGFANGIVIAGTTTATGNTTATTGLIVNMATRAAS